MAKETPAALTIEDLQAQLEAARAERDAAKSQADAALAEADQFRNAIKLDGKAKIPVRGTFKATVVVEGETVEKTYGFADGHLNIRLKDIGLVPTEQVLELAAGKKLAAEVLAEYPGLRAITNADGSSKGIAERELQRFAQIGYGYLVER